MAEPRVPTGIPGVDEILNGGLIAERSYLLVGSAGSGKTVFSVEWLLEGRRCGEPLLYITLTEPASDIQRNMASFGWQLDGIDLLDLTPTGDADESAEEYQIFAPSEVEHVAVWQAIYQAVKEKRPQRLVIDSITQLRYLSTDEYQFRKKILGLVSFLNRSKCTSLLSFETSELERETSVGLAVDGLIRLRAEVSPSRVIGLRSLQVEKFRGSGFISGFHPMRITDDGIHVFPHRIEPIGGSYPAVQLLSSGIPQLDELLGGGLESGTTTIISGPSGVGKTTLGVAFLIAAVAAGKRAVLFTFEEAVESLMIRSRGIGMPLDNLLEAGTLKVVRLNPMEQYPDEFLGKVRHAVEHEHFELVMIDSLRGYQLEMEQFGTPLDHVRNLVHFLNRHGVTSFLINEVEFITGSLRTTELAVSHLADNIILLRYAEYAGQVIKVMACLKKRLGDFQPDLRELQITGQGIRVGEKLENLHGILTGVPEYSDPV
ncbi:MAG TPA: ATPase domain-containing protein [Anaerolineae bacterium]|nr:ATPase domain-containing protein [Anaerolineae bacterium]